MRALHKIHLFLESHKLLLASLLLLLILRAPNFFEPYWYGDEAIYLTIGQALNRGATLYKTIVDHKTPLIYYLARVDTQLNFRVLLLLWMGMTTLSFYVFAKKIFKNISAVAASMFLLVVLTSLPWFEGMIPNGELFVMGFILLGAALLTKTSYFSYYLSKRLPSKKIPITSNAKLFVLAGITMSAGLLTKVPALFDVAAFGAVGLIPILDAILEKKRVIYSLVSSISHWIWLLIGLFAPIIFSIVYFVAKDAGPDYLQYGLLYNFRYSQSWDLGFSSAVLAWFFTFQGKFITMLVISAVLLFSKKIMSPITRWIGIWFVFALFATLLSNRPYPHYFMQTLPPLALIVGNIVDSFLENKKKKSFIKFIPTAAISFGLIILFLGILYSMKVGLYETKSYYVNWYQYITGSLSQEDYYQKFNGLMKDNYKASAILNQYPDASLYIWGTNPMLYAQTKKPSPARFTVAFHVKDLKYYDETIQHLNNNTPTFLVIMNEDENTFPDLTIWMKNKYYKHSTYDHFTLWKLI